MKRGKHRSADILGAVEKLTLDLNSTFPQNVNLMFRPAIVPIYTIYVQTKMKLAITFQTQEV